MPAPARLPVQLSTEAGYVEGDTAEQQLSDEHYLPVVEQQLADLEDDTSVFTFEDDFLKQPEGAIFRKWKDALMSDHTHSVAEMVVDGSWGSGNLGVKLLTVASTLFPCCPFGQTRISLTFFLIAALVQVWCVICLVLRSLLQC